MARGLRSSRLKKNNSKLRAKVFGPVIDERTQRLSRRLTELASGPRPDRDMAEHNDPPATEDQIEPHVQAAEDQSAEGTYMASRPCLEFPAPTSSTTQSQRSTVKHTRLGTSTQPSESSQRVPTTRESMDTNRQSHAHCEESIQGAEDEGNNSDSGISMTCETDTHDEAFLSALASLTGFTNSVTRASNGDLVFSSDGIISAPSHALYLALGLTGAEGPSLTCAHNTATFYLPHS